MTLTAVLILTVVSRIPALAEEEQTAEKAVIILLDTSGSMKTNDPERLVPDSITQLIYSLPSNYETAFVRYSTEASLLCGAADTRAEDIQATDMREVDTRATDMQEVDTRAIDMQEIDTQAAGIVTGEPHTDAAHAESAAMETASSRHRDNIAKLAAEVQYQGYSNAGAGLSRAVDALADTAAEEKYIIMFSDGEILLKGDGDTRESQRLYQDAVKRAADQGITIYTVGLGEDMENPENDIFRAAAMTGGKSWHVAQAAELQEKIDGILAEMGVKQSTVAIVDAGGGQEKISLELPYTRADRIKLLLTCDAPIQNLNSSFQAESARQINGHRYSLLEIERPTGGHLEISFETQQGKQVRINAVPEYSVIPRVEISYEDRLTEQTENPCYQRTATVSYSFYSMERPETALWEETFFDRGKISLEIHGIHRETKETYLQSGRIELQENVTTAQEYAVSFDYSQLPVNVIRGEDAMVTLAPPPPAPVEEPQPPKFPVGAAVAGILLLTALLVLLLLFLRRRRARPVPAPETQRPQPSKYSYVGKVNLYITRTKSGYDIPPLYYNLFRLPAGKVVSLQEILEECQVSEAFPGAEKIYFKPGTNRNLILTNNSDCTIMKSREILMKDRSYQLSMDAKLDISFEDEISELTLQYKDLKPGEAWQ